jgi:hypothetical protein
MLVTPYQQLWQQINTWVVTSTHRINQSPAPQQYKLWSLTGHTAQFKIQHTARQLTNSQYVMKDGARSVLDFPCQSFGSLWFLVAFEVAIIADTFSHKFCSSYLWSFMKKKLYINKPHSLKELEHHDNAAVLLSHTHTQALALWRLRRLTENHTIG